MAPQWDWMRERAADADVLNLFGYTGVGSLILSEAGARMVHVDASKKSVEGGKANAALSGLADRPIRWIVDDASKFTAREVRRGRRYDGILLDPPKFGRGPTGEVWRLEEDLAPLLADCRKLLDENSRFLVLTVYAVRMSALAIGELVKQTFGDLGGKVEVGEMSVREEARGLLLPTAIFAQVEPLGSRRADRRADDERRSGDQQQRHGGFEQQAARFRVAGRSGAEDQQRDCERQKEHAGQRPGARQSGRQRGDHDRERGEAGRADRQRDQRPPKRRRRDAEDERARQRRDQQQWAEGQPVSGDLGGADGLLGNAADGQLVEDAVGAIRLDQPFDRQQRRGERRDPQARRRRCARAGAGRARRRTGRASRRRGRSRPAARPRRRSLGGRRGR